MLKAFGRSTSGIHARPLSKVRYCRPKKFGRLPEGLSLHHPSPCTNPSKTALSFENCTIPRKLHYPSPRTKLASLVKGRWIDGKAQTLTLLHLLATRPLFFNLPNFSAVETEGLLYTTNPSKSALSLRLAPSPLPLNECFGSLPLSYRQVYQLE